MNGSFCKFVILIDNLDGPLTKKPMFPDRFTDHDHEDNNCFPVWNFLQGRYLNPERCLGEGPFFR
jgi:hypothetical protein